MCTMTTLRVPVLAAGILYVASLASTPVITQVLPAVPSPGDEPQTLSLHGSDFLPGLELEVMNPSGATEVYSGDRVVRHDATRVDVTLLIPAEGRYSFVVRNRDGGVSQPFNVAVKATKEPAAPVISQVTPANIRPHPEPQTLRVEGRRFETGLRAIVTDPVGTEIGDVQVRNLTPTAFELILRLTEPGDYGLSVSNPSGTVSNVYQLTVQTSR
jgi:hypothetical protein